MSQESQISECEIALKLKNDEVKELKGDKEVLNDRLEEVEKALMISDENVENLNETLLVTKVRFVYIYHLYIWTLSHDNYAIIIYKVLNSFDMNELKQFADKDVEKQNGCLLVTEIFRIYIQR